MSKRLYVGNLPWKITEDELRDFFSKSSEVTSVSIVKDRETGRSRGFGFVDVDDSESAIQNCHGAELSGRKLVVNEARERTPRNNGFTRS